MSNGLPVILLCARQERLLAMRSRWTQLFAVVFAGLALAVAFAGYVLSGGSGVQDFARTAASLVQLTLMVVPLTALVMGVLALTPDRGSAELLFAQPVSRRAVMLGTLLGLFQALVAAQAMGFGAAGVVIFARVGGEGLGGFVLVAVGSAMLTAVFLALAALVSAGQFGRRRVRALAGAIVIWFSLVLLFDVAILAVASTLRSGHASRLLISGVLVNPVDAVRTGALLAIEGSAAFGPASLALLRFTGGAHSAALAICASLLAWVAVPSCIAVWRLDRTDVA